MAKEKKKYPKWASEEAKRDAEKQASRITGKKKEYEKKPGMTITKKSETKSVPTPKKRDDVQHQAMKYASSQRSD